MLIGPVGAVDIGGTKISAGIADSKGTIITQQSIPTVTGSGGAVVSMEKVVRLLKTFCEHERIDRLQGIGVVCTGPVDVAGGIVQNPYTLPGWDQFPLCDWLQTSTGLPIYIENDANGALLGEVQAHGLFGRHVLMVTIGTGIGVAAVTGDTLYRAEDGYHPEMGHIIISKEGQTCYCGRRGCFEGLCSGTAVNLRAKQANYEDFDRLSQAAATGHSDAKLLLEDILEDICAGLWSLSVVFKPSVLILGGGLMSTYFKPVMRKFMKYIEGCQDFAGKPRILQAGEKGNSALLGAAMLCRNACRDTDSYLKRSNLCTKT